MSTTSSLSSASSSGGGDGYSATPHKSVFRNPQRHKFHNKAALILTMASLVLLVVLSVVFGDNNNGSRMTTMTSNYDGRWLEDANDDGNNNNDGDDDDGNGSTDYSRFSCRYIYDQVPESGYAQCQFAKTCNGGEGVWAPFVFCKNNDTLSTMKWFLILSPILLLWMVTLFKLLGSTAEDYFSPSLEMFSVKLGLPPRFAGVSLLALGNGAADVSATMSAIVNDEENGYKFSLGALTGAAMLVGGVVAGIVVLVAGGVPCRGALVRDVTALFLTIVVVWWNLATGEVGPSTITLFLSLYGVFVCLVLVADIYHRKVVLPRLAAIAAVESASADPNATNAAMEGQTPLPGAPAPPSTFSRFITAISNYDNPCLQDTTTTTTTTTGNNVENNGDVQEEGDWGITSGPTPQQQQLQQPLEADPDAPIILHGQHGLLHHGRQHHGPGGNPLSSSQDGGQPTTTTGGDQAGGVYTLVEDHMDQICGAPGAANGAPASNWRGAFHDGKQEIVEHIHQVWDDIFYDGDVHCAEKILLCCELPFTFLRKATVPIPCEGYYNRGVLALSMALSPFWFAYYIYSGHGVNLLAKGFIVYFFIIWGVAIACAAMVLRYAPGGEGNMALGVATPIALYGFVMAATWIDFVADHLVALLDFVGIILHIPGAVMGLTILAWGNSMGDLSANMTMARKGLANMAMTACFAGPVFNILIGLGLGFSQLSAATGKAESAVSLSPPIITGFVFVILNCFSILMTGIFLGKGRIESYYGYTAITLYSIYVVTSIYLQFSKYGDDSTTNP